MSEELIVQEGDVATSPFSEDPVYSASDLIELYSKAYIEEIFHNHLPSNIDGFKTIYRRYLYALRLANRTTGIMKSGRAVAELMDAHPYNDQSMYEIIMRLAQDWNFKPTLVESPSNIGSYSGNEQAAARYTESGLTQYTRDVIFEGIDIDAIPKIPGASLDVEPKFFVPALPLALLMNNLTIGYGKGCLTTRLNLGNVCDLVVDYAQWHASRPTGRYLAEKNPDLFLPDFTTPCVVTNWRDLRAAYSNRLYNTPINMTGRVVITRDRIVVQSLPQGLPFITAINSLQEHIENNRNGSIDRKVKTIIAPRSKMNLGNLTITPRQGVNTLSLWREIAPVIKFSGRFHPNPNYRTESGYVFQVDYPGILERWFKQRHTIVMSTKRRRLQVLTRHLWIAEAHMVVVKNPDRCIEIIRNMTSEQNAIDLFKDEFGLTPFQSKVLLDQNLRILAKISESKLTDRISSLQNQINAMMDSFSHIGEEIAAGAVALKKKYEKGRTTHLPDYIGYLSFENGKVLFETADEVSEILAAFPKEPATIHMFESPNVICLNEAGKLLRTDLHRYMYGDILSFTGDPKGTALYTVNLENKTACYSPGVKLSPRRPLVFYTERNAIGLTRNGRVRPLDVTTLSKRLNALDCIGAKSDLIHLFTDPGSDFYVAQFNPTEPNLLVIQKVAVGQSTFITSPVGEPVTFVSTTGKDWFITPPQNCLSRNTTRVIHIDDVEKALEGQSLLRYDLNGKNRRSTNIDQLS